MHLIAYCIIRMPALHKTFSVIKGMSVKGQSIRFRWWCKGSVRTYIFTMFCQTRIRSYSTKHNENHAWALYIYCAGIDHISINPGLFKSLLFWLFLMWYVLCLHLKKNITPNMCGHYQLKLLSLATSKSLFPHANMFFFGPNGCRKDMMVSSTHQKPHA